MGQYLIRDIEHLSGIKSHTIRIWEKRYNIVEPKRTTTNRRYYDDNDLKRILNISILNRSGYKISQIANLSNNRLNEEILRLTNESQDLESHIGSLISAMIDFDVQRFEKIFSKSIMQRGFRQTILKVIHPFLGRIGILWLTENIDPAHEHFISNMIRQKIISAIDGLPDYTDKKKQRFVLFLPEDQWHEMGILICHYLIKKKGFSAIYFGSSLPVESVINLREVVEFDNIVTAVGISKPNIEKKQDLVQLANLFPDKTIFIGGGKGNNTTVAKQENIIFLDQIEEFDRYLDSLD